MTLAPLDGLLLGEEWDDFEYKLLTQIEELSSIDFDSKPLVFKRNTLAFAFIHHARQLLKDEAAGTIDELTERLKTYEHFKTFLLTVHLTGLAYKAGALPDVIRGAEKYSEYRNGQAKKRTKRKIYKGLSLKQRAERNQNILKSWQNSKLSLHSFAARQSKKYKISITQIKNILKNNK